MDQEELFLLAEKKLSKFVDKYDKAEIYDLNSLQKFKNLVECIPGIEETNEFQQLLDETEDLIFFGTHKRKTSKTASKVAKIVELFITIKNECLTSEEKESSLGEKIFLTVCAVSWTMLMFAP